MHIAYVKHNRDTLNKIIKKGYFAYKALNNKDTLHQSTANKDTLHIIIKVLKKKNSFHNSINSCALYYADYVVPPDA